MSEREELEGHPSRRDPLASKSTKKGFLVFGIISLIIMLWPIWLLLGAFLLMLLIWLFAGIAITSGIN